MSLHYNTKRKPHVRNVVSTKYLNRLTTPKSVKKDTNSCYKVSNNLSKMHLYVLLIQQCVCEVRHFLRSRCLCTHSTVMQRVLKFALRLIFAPTFVLPVAAYTCMFLRW